MILFLAFVYGWAYVSSKFLDDLLWIRTPVFVLAGLASLCAAVAAYRCRPRSQLSGPRLLTTGFSLWALYLASYPFVHQGVAWQSAQVLLGTALQLLIAVSMIVLMLEEARVATERMWTEIQTVRSEKEALQLKVLSAEAGFRSLLGPTALKSDLQHAYDQLRQTQQMVVQQERLRALGQMASGIAHDINNSLTPIIGYSDYLLDGESGISEETRKCLGFVRTAAGDIAHIVEQVRHFCESSPSSHRISPSFWETRVKSARL
jgi:C4-dicarboxylate-specific signal transduction histidine kinase